MRRLILALFFALSLSPARAQNVTDSRSFSNISATTSPFTLKGGNYQVCAVATFGGGSVKFETLGPDGSTYLPVNSATSFTANGCGNSYAAPGQFEIVIATASAVYVSVAAIPQ